MTETGRQQERPGAEDAGRGQAHEEYREAPEFARGDGKPSEAGTPFETLRVFKDGNDVPRAGLYPGTTPEMDDHWAHGDPMTDETDVAVARRLTGDAESERVRLFFVGGPISLSGGGEAGGNWIRQGVVRSGGGAGGRRYFCRQRPMGDFRWSSRAS